MNFTQQYTEKLNLNISPETYAKIEQEANKEGRKAGNYARRLLDEWVMNRKEHDNNRREKNMEH